MRRFIALAALVLAGPSLPAFAAPLDYTINGTIGDDTIFGQGVTNALDPQEENFSITISGSDAILAGYTGTYVPTNVSNNVSPYAYLWINETPNAQYSPPAPGDLPGFDVYNLSYSDSAGSGVTTGTYSYYFYILDLSQDGGYVNPISYDFSDNLPVQITFTPAAPVPEPGTIGLLGLALGGLAAFRRISTQPRAKEA